MYEFTVNGVEYVIEFEQTAYIFADIYVGRIYDTNEDCVGVIMVDETDVVLKRVKNDDVRQYVETHTDSIAEYANCI